MKDLVANKPLTMENEDVRINRRCSALLLNQLPLKEKDLGSFILPCSIGRLDFNNALEDLGEAIEENTKPILGKPHWCAPIYRQNNGIREVWASCNPSSEECDRGSSRNNEIRCYGKSKNDNDCTNIEWNGISLNDWLKIKYGEVDETIKKKILTEHWRKRFGIDYNDNNDFYDPDQCVDGRNNEIRERIIHNLHEEWFKGTFDEEDDIEGIIDYLEQTSYDGFVDLD
ncbi:hypothetical protein Tco_0917529 [Tanacetum coccineum]